MKEKTDTRSFPQFNALLCEGPTSSVAIIMFWSLLRLSERKAGRISFTIQPVAYKTLQTTQVLTALYSLYGSTQQFSYLQFRLYL